jgi:N-methylhydantoinase A
MAAVTLSFSWFPRCVDTLNYIFPVDEQDRDRIVDPSASARLAVDIGGTFTDVVLELPEGGRVTTKLLTTHSHPGEAVLNGIGQVLQQAGISPSHVGLIIHGTTLATNALIERSGAVTALLTTEGHRDALEMAHEDRFEQYDVMIDRPRPLVPRYLRLPVRERMDCNGRVLLPLNESSIEAALPVMDEHGVESVAIAYLHVFVNPEHEQRTAKLLQASRPQLSISLASEVCPEIREFERISTACANAYVRPLMARYLERLAGELKGLGFNCPFLLMTSGGGLTTLETAAKFPIRLVESGPAGGAILAQYVARQAGLDRVLSFDMGGTTAKLCLIDDFEPLMSRSFEVDRVYRFKKGSGLPLRIPVIEMVEIGAGGGSIAQMDKLGRIQVGPGSAGSEPGPAAYGRGGKKPAVTDADLLLGRIVAGTFAGGAFELDTAAAETALQKDIAEPLGLDVETAAFGVSEVVDENMAAAARAHAAEFGMDLGQRDMVAFGGAAPLHAARLGEKLGVKRIIVPAEAGVGSAVGFLLAPVAYEVVRSRRQNLSALQTEVVNALMEDMRQESLAVVRLGSAGDGLQETRHAYMRYVGQGHEIPVILPVETYGDHHGAVFRSAFEAAYRQLYGRIINGVDIEVLSWTLTISAPVPEVKQTPAILQTDRKPPEPVEWQALFDPAREKAVNAPVYLRGQLQAGDGFQGPALITEDQTTTVVGSNYLAAIDARGHIVMTRQQGNRDD